MSRFLNVIGTIILASIACGPRAHAKSADNLYAGVGLFRSTATYKAGAAESTFNGWGAAAIGGIGFTSGRMGFFAEGEYGRVESMNTIQSTTYMEKSLNTYISGKLGASYEMFGIGAGIQQNTIDVDNVATLGTSGRTTYKGLNYSGFARLTLDSKESSFRTIVEAKYGTGSFSGLEVNETSLSLRFVFLPF